MNHCNLEDLYLYPRLNLKLFMTHHQKAESRANFGPGTTADLIFGPNFSILEGLDRCKQPQLVPKQFLQLPLPFFLQEFIKSKCFMINRFALIDLRWRKAHLSTSRARVATNVHVEQKWRPV